MASKCRATSSRCWRPRRAPVPPDDDGWAYEIKWDGIRALAYISADGRLRLAARRGADHTPRYPELAAHRRRARGREAILDGEIVAFDESGRPSFQLLQRRMGLTTESTIRVRAAETPATYVAFDLLWLDGRSLLAEPYERRRELLAGPRLRRPQLAGAGASRRRRRAPLGGDPRAPGPRGDRRQAAAAAPTGPGSAAASGSRSATGRGQELVIGGWMPGEGSPRRAGRVAAGRPLGRDPRGGGAASGARSGSSTPAASAPASPRRCSTG